MDNGRKPDPAMPVSYTHLDVYKRQREMGIVTVGMLGGDGKPAIDACDHVLLVPDTETARIQECHIALGHGVLELLEDRLIASGAA